jgi:uncharacterized protein (TIGR02594 family)
MTKEEACLSMHSLAYAEMGVHEVGGSKANQRIVEYDKHTTLCATSDEVPWCSAFANYVADSAGFPGTHSAAAASWRAWGVSLDAPIKGCVVVLPRFDPCNPNAAHVTFCDHPDISNGIIRCVGGNQSDSVSIGRFKIKGAVYRAPKVEE